MRRVAVLAVVAACHTFSVPSDVCHPDDVNGKVVDGHADVLCTACLQDKCCDDVGRCQADPACASEVSKTQACVVAGGISGGAVERRCVDDNLHSARKSTLVYACMREQCGVPCGLPVCRVDPAAGLVVNATCDTCFTGSCCDFINECYGNRACKLIVDCVASTCQASLGSTLTSLDPNVASGACTTDAASIGPSCVGSCIDRFSELEQGLLVDAAKTARCLATRVVACGARASCSAKCNP